MKVVAFLIFSSLWMIHIRISNAQYRYRRVPMHALAMRSPMLVKRWHMPHLRQMPLNVRAVPAQMNYPYHFPMGPQVGIGGIGALGAMGAIGGIGPVGPIIPQKLPSRPAPTLPEMWNTKNYIRSTSSQEKPHPHSHPSPPPSKHEYDYHIQSNQIPKSKSKPKPKPKHTPKTTSKPKPLPKPTKPKYTTLVKQVDDKGPIHTIPAPKLGPQDKPDYIDERQPGQQPTIVELQSSHQYNIPEQQHIETYTKKGYSQQIFPTESYQDSFQWQQQQGNQFEPQHNKQFEQQQINVYDQPNKHQYEQQFKNQFEQQHRNQFEQQQQHINQYEQQQKQLINQYEQQHRNQFEQQQNINQYEQQQQHRNQFEPQQQHNQFEQQQNNQFEQQHNNQFEQQHINQFKQQQQLIHQQQVHNQEQQHQSDVLITSQEPMNEMSQQDIYKIFNNLPQQPIKAYAYPDQPQLQQHYQQQQQQQQESVYKSNVPQHQFFQPETSYEQSIKSIDFHPQFQTFNYEEPTEKDSHLTVEYKPAQNKDETVPVTPEAQSQFVQNFFDLREENVANNNVEPETNVEWNYQNFPNVPDLKEELITGTSYYSSLPNKQAADTLASLQEAGHQNTNILQINEELSKETETTGKKTSPMTIYVPDEHAEDSEKNNQESNYGKSHQGEKESSNDGSYEYDDSQEDAQNAEISDTLDESFGTRIKPKKY